MLRLDFHIGRVECVTCHVPESQVGGGRVKEGGCGRGVVVGGRREIEAAMGDDWQLSVYWRERFLKAVKRADHSRKTREGSER